MGNANFGEKPHISGEKKNAQKVFQNRVFDIQKQISGHNSSIPKMGNGNIDGLLHDNNTSGKFCAK